MFGLITLYAFSDSATLYFENDFFHSRDYAYTHGTKVTTTFDDWSVFVWQGIYTPKDKATIGIVQNDRPYAGWLAIGFDKNYQWKTMQLLTEISVGVVGPSSRSEETQKNIHKMLDNFMPRGWDNQLEDEPAIQIRQEFRKSFWIINNVAVVVPQSEIVAGTVMDYLGAGVDMMIGLNPNPHPYPYPAISVRKKDMWSAYTIFGARGRYVAWNTLLDGNIWHDSHSVESEPLVGELYAGLCVSYNKIAVSFVDIVRTREFTTQDKPEKFGCLTFTVFF